MAMAIAIAVPSAWAFLAGLWLGHGCPPLRQNMGRFGAAWSTLRGKPTAYRLHVVGGIEVGPNGATINECTFDGTRKAEYAISIPQGLA